MDDYISKQKAIETAMTMYERCTTGDIIDLRDMICESLAVLPPADAVSVVRCKDCRWKLWTQCTRFEYLPVTDEDYCSKAERRTDA